MCLNETYSKVRVGEHLYDMFPTNNGLKPGDALPPSLFSFALEQCFSTAGPLPGTGPGINYTCHFSFLSILHE